MSEASPHPETAATPERSPDGRFQPGNHGGPGNPYARQCALLRKAIHQVVTEQAMLQLCYQLLHMAQTGDLAAAKLLFQYAIGKPQPAPDPDTLDAHEMRCNLASAFSTEELEPLTRAVPLQGVNLLHAVSRDALEASFAQRMVTECAEMDTLERNRAERQRRKQERKRRRRAARRASAPMANGSNGQPPVAAPMANGSNGAPPKNGHNPEQFDPLFDWLRSQRPPNGDAQSR